ncbi:MAG: TetR/AcrR family transcriptional regulator [Pseudomonadota bacterium]
MNKAAVSEKVSARDRLLAAAGELFYEEGINTVGIDRVIEHAGVAKASLYNTFGSKDELIRAYLHTQLQARQERINARLAKSDDPRAQLLGVFDVMRETASRPEFRGCAFVRASAELKPGSAVKVVCDESRAWTRALFTRLAKEVGAHNPHVLADQLVLLYDGAAVSAQMDGSGKGAVTARALAAQLLDIAQGLRNL